MRLGHVGLTAADPDGLADFYTGFLGLTRVAEALTEQTGRLILLSTRPGAAPDLQLLSNPDARHVAFEVDTLAELRERHAAAVARGVRVLFSFDHGATLSFYVLDPAGNACELYWAPRGHHEPSRGPHRARGGPPRAARPRRRDPRAGGR